MTDLQTALDNMAAGRGPLDNGPSGQQPPKPRSEQHGIERFMNAKRTPIDTSARYRGNAEAAQRRADEQAREARERVAAKRRWPASY